MNLIVSQGVGSFQGLFDGGTNSNARAAARDGCWFRGRILLYEGGVRVGFVVTHSI